MTRMTNMFAAALLASAATGGAAHAQTTPAPATTAPATTTAPAATTAQPSASAPSGMGTDPAMSAQPGGNGMMQSQGGFYTYQQGNQMLGSGLMGARVMGAGNEDIGEVDDLVLDRNGQVMAIVVGVGGFLGLGEKDVAIANDQMEFVLAQDAAAGNAAAPATATTAPATTGTAANRAATTGTTAAVPGATTTGAMAPATGTAGMAGMRAGTMGYGWNWTGAGIDHIQVDFTREQLESAPAFEAAS